MKNYFFKFTHKAILKAIIAKYGYDVPVGFRIMAMAVPGVDWTTIKRMFRRLRDEGLVTIEPIKGTRVMYHINKDLFKIIAEREKNMLSM